MARSSAYFYILQFDQHLISALKVRRSGGEKLEIAGFWRKRGDWPAETGELAGALREFVQEHDLQGGEVYTILPRHEMTTRIVTMPSQSRDEIFRMVEYSAEEYVPYRRTEIVLDCVILETQPDGHSRVLAVLAHHDVVEQHVKRLQEAGLEPAGVFASTACLASAARAAGSSEESGRYALANLGSAGFEVVIMHDGKLSFGRGIATAQDWTQAGDDPHVSEELAIEMRGSLSAYRRESEDGLGVDAVYLCSDWAGVAKASEALTPELSYPVQEADFARALVAEGKEHLDVLPLTALGAALTVQGHAAWAINLESESLRKARSSRTLRRSVLQYAGLAAAALVLVGTLFFQHVHYTESYAEELRQQVETIRPAAQNIIEKQRQLAVLQSQVERGGTVLEYLARVTEVAPDDVNLTRFYFVYGQGIMLEGRAKSFPDLDQFVGNLRTNGRENGDFFRNAVITTQRSETERDESVTAYQISIPMRDVDVDEVQQESEVASVD